MNSATPTNLIPVPAILVYGTPTSPDLTQASWFRAEDKQAAKAAAEALKFSVIDIQTDVEKALTVGVPEGALKGSGRMIVGSVTTEVYRRIEAYARKESGANHSSKLDSTAPAAAKLASEQTTNIDAVHATATSSHERERPFDGVRQQNVQPHRPWPIFERRVPEYGRARSLGCIARRVPCPRQNWQKNGEPDGWWVAVITGIDKNDFIIRWPDEPKTPPLKIERKHVAILHPAFDVTREWERRP